MPYSLRPPGFSRASKIVDVVAVQREAMRAGEPGRSGADDGDALSCRRGAAERMLAALHQKIGGVALQLADLDRLVLGEVADARLLAERLDRADAGADAAHDVGLENGLAGAAGIVGLDLADEERDVDVRRAGLHAGRVEAEIAAVGLDEGLVARQRRMQVGEVAGVVVRLKPPGGNVRTSLTDVLHLITPRSPTAAAISHRQPSHAKDEPGFRRGQFFYQLVNFSKDRTVARPAERSYGKIMGPAAEIDPIESASVDELRVAAAQTPEVGAAARLRMRAALQGEIRSGWHASRRLARVRRPRRGFRSPQRTICGKTIPSGCSPCR